MSESRGWSFPDYAHVGFRKSAGRCVHCAVYCYRECALCGRWVCHACRHGSGWWVACQGCDVHELARARVRHELADAHERMIAAYEAWAHKCLRCGAPHGLLGAPATRSGTLPQLAEHGARVRL